MPVVPRSPRTACSRASGRVHTGRLRMRWCDGPPWRPLPRFERLPLHRKERSFARHACACALMCMMLADSPQVLAHILACLLLVAVSSFKRAERTTRRLLTMQRHFRGTRDVASGLSARRPHRRARRCPIGHAARCWSRARCEFSPSDSQHPTRPRVHAGGCRRLKQDFASA